jgi:hypothetical protein
MDAHLSKFCPNEKEHSLDDFGCGLQHRSHGQSDLREGRQNLGDISFDFPVIVTATLPQAHAAKTCVNGKPLNANATGPN